MTLQNLYGIVALVVCAAGEGYMLWTVIRRAIQKRQAVYAVGSPEYNAQIVGMVRTVNEQIAARGQRLPEKTAIDIILLTDSEDSQQ